MQHWSRNLGRCHLVAKDPGQGQACTVANLWLHAAAGAGAPAGECSRPGHARGPIQPHAMQSQVGRHCRPGHSAAGYSCNGQPRRARVAEGCPGKLSGGRPSRPEDVLAASQAPEWVARPVDHGPSGQHQRVVHVCLHRYAQIEAQILTHNRDAASCKRQLDCWAPSTASERLKACIEARRCGAKADALAENERDREWQLSLRTLRGVGWVDPENPRCNCLPKQDVIPTRWHAEEGHALVVADGSFQQLQRAVARERVGVLRHGDVQLLAVYGEHLPPQCERHLP
mmetsp:Transcript_59364/g.173632  ORF Transcript_59364/g.173632 Transcript_59364/m.173632 type:complete len:285 (+) Transcript_59364:269-1123(+)